MIIILKAEKKICNKTAGTYSMITIPFENFLKGKKILKFIFML